MTILGLFPAERRFEVSIFGLQNAGTQSSRPCSHSRRSVEDDSFSNRKKMDLSLFTLDLIWGFPQRNITYYFSVYMQPIKELFFSRLEKMLLQ